MYNRYIPAEDQQQPEREACHNSSADSCCEENPPQHNASAPDGVTGLIRHFLDQFHLNHVDTGDLLLLGLLFFLFREDADEELLVALGLLLIL